MKTNRRFALKTSFKQLLADTHTPVSIYLKLRDQFPGCFLLESTDYKGKDNSVSYICCEPIAEFRLERGEIYERYPDGEEVRQKATDPHTVFASLDEFASRFEHCGEDLPGFVHAGLFGYLAYDAVQCVEDIGFDESKRAFSDVPDIFYRIFKHVIAIDHYSEQLCIFSHQLPDDNEAESAAEVSFIENAINRSHFSSYPFSVVGDESANMTDERLLEIIRSGIAHCHRGDVFQIVLSKRFSKRFTGDEFNVYRALRSINPSPYLFYFDFGSFRIFGSSPESQAVVKDGIATVYPIAGTAKRTGEEVADKENIERLKADPKENAEHVMLVDLARNDLSHYCENVSVESFREVHLYSHVIHLVSKVTGKLRGSETPLKVLGRTFPAGTLSGAPKHRAMQLIDELEGTRRHTYGGAIGFIGFNGDCNHAIIIRSFLSVDNTLYYQGGAGIVADSVPENEVAEINNKLRALRKAIEMAVEV